MEIGATGVGELTPGERYNARESRNHRGYPLAGKEQVWPFHAKEREILAAWTGVLGRCEKKNTV